MSVRRATKNRLTLFRECGTCGKSFVTTADTPFVRQLYDVGGKHQKTTYFCSGTCMYASYKYKGFYDGKADERRKARQQAQNEKRRGSPQERDRCRKYNEAHREERRARRMEHYWTHHEEELAANRFYKKKRKLLEEEKKDALRRNEA